MQAYLEAEILNNGKREENQYFKLLPYFRKFLDIFICSILQQNLLSTCYEPNIIPYAWEVLVDKEMISALVVYSLGLNTGEKVKVAQCVQLFASPWTIQSMEFLRPGYWSG